MRPFRDLEVWKLGHEIALDVYRVTRTFPREELYGLTSQMRRAGYSIPMNVVEGSVKSDAQFHQALRVSLGSASELEYQLILALDLVYMERREQELLSAKVQREQRMLVSFMKRLQPQAVPSEPHARTRAHLAEDQFLWDLPTADSREPIADSPTELDVAEESAP